MGIGSSKKKDNTTPFDFKTHVEFKSSDTDNKAALGAILAQQLAENDFTDVQEYIR